VACPDPIEVCDGDPIVFTPPGATDDCDPNPTVVCTRNDGLALNDPYPVGVTIITCTATDACGNQSQCSTTVTVNPNPSCVMDPFDPFTPGVLTGTISGGTPPYASCSATVIGVGWSVDSCILSGTDNEDITVNYSVTQMAAVSPSFTVTVIDDKGCQSTCEQDVTVLQDCVIVPAAHEICEGDSATFCTIPTAGFPPFQVTWQGPSGPVAGNNCVDVPHLDANCCITVSEAGIYTATITDALGFASTCEGVSVVNPNPSCVMDPSDPLTPGVLTGTISGGTPPYASCSATVVGVGWSVDSCVLSGTDNEDITVNYSVTQPAATSASFTVTVIDDKGCQSKCELDVNIIKDCDVVPAAQEICEGDSATFCAIPTAGSPPFQVSWQGPSGPVAGNNCVDVPLLDPNCCITVSEAGTYTATVTDALGFESICEGVLVVNPNPTCTVEPPTAEICAGDEQEFCATVSGGTAPYTVVWEDSSGAVLQTCPGLPENGECCFIATEAGTYTAVITDDKGCTGSCTATLTALDCVCRVTGGGNDMESPWPWDQTFAEGKHRNLDGNGLDRYTFGGQAGAPTANQPQPYGEWTHRQHNGPSGKFTFHAGTASAPDGTEIDLIFCRDFNNCLPARPAPAKQIDFEGVGSFKNIHGPGPVKDAGAKPGKTLHWFEVHIEDLGEPGNKEDAGADCPAEGSAGSIADCGCADFYEISIHKTSNPASDIIYWVRGYLKGGNLQIHPPID
jgi:hypothetical protein